MSKSHRVRSIADGTFANMKSLRYAALPDSVLTLGKALYSGCDSLRYIDWQNCKSMPISNIDRSDEESPFYGMNRRTLVYVPLAVATDDLDENVVNTSASGLWQAKSYYTDDQQTVEVPLSEMFGYATQLRSMTQGRATYTMEFKHYSEAPRNVADAIVSARAK